MPRRAIVWGIVFAGWTLVAAAFAVGSSLTYVITYQPPQWTATLKSSLTEWYAWAALTPLVAWLARRLPLSGRRRIRSAIALGVLGVPAGMAKLVLSQILRAAAGVSGYATIGNVAAQYLIYWGIVAIVHAADYYSAEQARELRASRAEAGLAEARLQLLKAQLHPHFLFNTLNTISELVHEDTAAAERTIGDLSDLLRETLDAGDVDRIPLSRELALVGRYLQIQRARYGPRLQAAIDAPPEAAPALVPIFILQPLVENAVTHAVAARADAGRIAIRARRDGATLVVTVEDDGPGVAAGGVRDGIGLGNVRARLRHVYGADHALAIENRPGGGAVARLTVPWHVDADAAPA